MSYLVLDYETRSEASIKDVGGFEYANHPSTEIMCVAWKYSDTKQGLETAETCWWSPFDEKQKWCASDLAIDLGYAGRISAHNAFFEQVITKFVLKKYVDLDSFPIYKWHCTAAQARALALPGKLELLCEALDTKHRKDMAGHRLMLKWSKPKRASKKNSDKWCSDPAELQRIIEYCIADVEAETEIFLKIPELLPSEEKIWQLDQKINWRGFHVDRPLVKTILNLISEEEKDLLKKSDDLTLGEFRPTQRAKLLQWFDGEGLKLPNLQAATVRDTLERKDISEDCRLMLKVQQSTSKTSAKKYMAFERRSRTDSRIRDHLVYHGASTGRWAGAGVQVQNLPARGAIKAHTIACDAISDGDLALVRLLFGDAMAAFSGVVRNMITATPGYELFCADYSAIELRVLFWVAREIGALQDLHNGEDLYKALAAKIYAIDIKDVTKDMRDVGKRAILGAGYGMGAPKFILTCKQFANIEIEEEVAKKAIATYRETFKLVPALWYNLEKCAIAAVQNPDKTYSTNRVKWFKRGKFLYCELPSGRRLSYYGPEVRMKKTPWGEDRPALHHWGMDQFTKKWTLGHTYGGSLTENVCSAIARDFMASAMQALEDRRYRVLFSVHDEVLSERKKGRGTLEEFNEIMTTLPNWGIDCFLKVEGWQGDRYRKG